MCVIVLNFVPISQAIPEIWPFLIFQHKGGPPSWIYSTHVWTTHKEYLVVSVTVQNLAGIGAVI